MVAALGNFVILGEPVSGLRARMGSHGGWYLPSKVAKYKEKIAWEIKTQAKNLYFYQGEPLKVEMTFFLPKKTKKSTITSRPDLDNLEKPVLDALQGVLFDNDSQIIEQSSRKRYSNRPRIEITIKKSDYGHEFVD